MNNTKIEWKIGLKMPIRDIMNSLEGELVGFIVNQCPVSWENKTTYRNHADRTIYLVFKYESSWRQGEIGYCICVPRLDGYFSEVMHDSVPYSYISLSAIEFGDSPEQLIEKLKENRVFTTKLSYEAKYQEGYVDESKK